MRSNINNSARRSSMSPLFAAETTTTTNNDDRRRHVVIVGAGWGGLSAAWALSKQQQDVKVTLLEASPRVGGLVRDGFTTQSGTRPAEAGQHGFWNNYHNIYNLLENDLGLDMQELLTDYAEQGQYSPRGLEAVWPVYQQQSLTLPTGLAQAAYTKFMKLSPLDRLTAAPLVLAFSEFDDSPEAWKKYDEVSFRDLCIKLGVSRKCYEEAFEPMILTGLFAPGAECSAAAALGMAYFFVLQSQAAFDVQWCKGNIGDQIFTPWIEAMMGDDDDNDHGVTIETSTRVTGFQVDNNNDDGSSSSSSSPRISKVMTTKEDGSTVTIEPDEVILAVGAKALNAFVTYSPDLAQFPELRRFANLRGTSVLATRIFLDKDIDVTYSANACWGFDNGVGMTVFDIKAIHGNDASTVQDAPGSVLEVDYYHASNLLLMSDDELVQKVKRDLDTMFACRDCKVVDAAIVRLPQAVNWYYPGSYKDMPDVKSSSLSNLYFCGDIVRTRHGSWSQEKAYVTGVEAANAILKRNADTDVLPMSSDEPHVAFGKQLAATAKQVLGPVGPPSLVDFLW